MPVGKRPLGQVAKTKQTKVEQTKGEDAMQMATANGRGVEVSAVRGVLAANIVGFPSRTWQSSERDGLHRDRVAPRKAESNDAESIAAAPSPGTGRIAPAPLEPEQERLLIEHLPAVRYIARSIHERVPQHVELEELISAGTLGLLDAVRRFNPDKSVQFRSYAQFRIRGAILDSLRSLDWSPRELRRKGRMLAEAGRTLRAQLQRPPVDTELAATLDMPLAELQSLTARLRGLEIGSLHEERGEDSGEEELSFLPAKESENPLFQCLQGEARRRLAEAITALPERERCVMTLYYFEEKTMKEIGLVLGVVESRVSQIHHLTLKRLRSGLQDLGGRRKVQTHPAILRAARAS